MRDRKAVQEVGRQALRLVHQPQQDIGVEEEAAAQSSPRPSKQACKPSGQGNVEILAYPDPAPEAAEGAAFFADRRVPVDLRDRDEADEQSASVGDGFALKRRLHQSGKVVRGLRNVGDTIPCI